MNCLKSVVITPSNLNGTIKVPSSKSICHRAVICGALAKGKSTMENVTFSKDIDATINAMVSLGACFKKDEDNISITGCYPLNIQNNSIDCSESGSTLRFIIPILLLTNDKFKVTGHGRLKERSLKPYYDLFDKNNIFYQNSDGNLPLTLNGRLKSGIYEIRGDVSSQFISGLLFALPLLHDDSKIKITGDIESKAYIDMTMNVMRSFSVNTEWISENTIEVYGNQIYKGRDYKIEGDYSQASFWLAAGIIGDKICCTDLDKHSMQGDSVIIELLRKMGGNAGIDESGVYAMPSDIKGIKVDVSQCPDIVPILAVLGSLGNGTMEITNAHRLRDKESDRLHAVTEGLNKLGADIHEYEDGLIINGKQYLSGGTVNSFNDHRIAMALAVASIRCSGSVTIEDSECVQKSYPEFWNDFSRLGGKLYERDMG